MPKIWKGLATLLLLMLAFWPTFDFERQLPRAIWVLWVTGAFAYLLSLFLNAGIPAPRRIASSFLGFVGIIYFLAGIVGLIPNWDFIEVAIWRLFIVSPYLLISFLGQLVRKFPYSASRAPYELLPASKHYFLSTFVLLIGAASAVAAFGMAHGKRKSYGIWATMIGISVISLSGYVVVGWLSWGPEEAIVPSCWVASYVVAYVVARRDLGRGSIQGEVAQ